MSLAFPIDRARSWYLVSSAMCTASKRLLIRIIVFLSSFRLKSRIICWPLNRGTKAVIVTAKDGRGRLIEVAVG